MTHSTARSRVSRLSAFPTETSCEQVGRALMTILQEVSRELGTHPELRQALHELASRIAAETSSVTEPDNDEARPSRPRFSDVTDNDLELMIQRCRLKAEGARWAVERDERLRDGADFAVEIRPEDHAIIDRARRLPNCFLWTNQPRDDISRQADDFLLISDCYDALALALDALQTSIDEQATHYFMEAINLVAQAQSGLRTAVSLVESHPDTDQQMAYHWLRNRANEDRFYIARFMKISDPADPEECDSVMEQAATLLDRISGETQLTLQKQRLFEQLQAVLGRITGSLLETLDDGEDSLRDWDQVFWIVDRLVTRGITADDARLRDLLLPLVDDIPDMDMPENVASVLDNIDSTAPTDSQTIPVRRTSQGSRQATAWLRGRTIVLVGLHDAGTIANDVAAAFNLQAAECLDVSDARSLGLNETRLARADVAVVVSCGDDLTAPVAESCGRLHRLHLNVPADTDASQIIEAITALCQTHGHGGSKSSVA